VFRHFQSSNFASRDEISIILSTKPNTVVIDLEKTIVELIKMQSKIQLLLSLNMFSERVHKSLAIYADTTSNVHLTHEERSSMPISDLLLLNRQGEQERDDINIYTTWHEYVVV